MTIMARMEALAACLSETIIADGNAEPCWVGIMPGQAALIDALGDSCDGGIAWVRMVTSYPIETLGQQSQRPGNCGTGIGFDLEVGFMRVIDVDEEAPDPATSLAIAEQQLKDMQTMRKAINCCPGLPNQDYILGQYTPSGPLGATVGGTWTLFCGL